MRYLALLPVLLTPLLMAQDSAGGFVRFTPEQVEWTMRENGSAIVILEGDPQSEGFYIQRIRFPTGMFTRPRPGSLRHGHLRNLVHAYRQRW